MRWDDLFADLEAQGDAQFVAERGAEVGDRTRMEVGGLGVGDRLRAAVGTDLRLRLRGDLTVHGSLQRAGVDWVLVDEGNGREAVVPLAAVLWIGGLGRRSAVPGTGGAVHARLGLRHALRGVARDRSGVRLHLVDGSVLDATVDRVGADFIDVAAHAAGELRRRDAVRDVQTVPLASLAALRRDG